VLDNGFDERRESFFLRPLNILTTGGLMLSGRPCWLCQMLWVVKPEPECMGFC
jgi:hypothetical protein